MPHITQHSSNFSQSARFLSTQSFTNKDQEKQIIFQQFIQFLIQSIHQISSKQQNYKSQKTSKFYFIHLEQLFVNVQVQHSTNQELLFGFRPCQVSGCLCQWGTFMGRFVNMFNVQAVLNLYVGNAGTWNFSVGRILLGTKDSYLSSHRPKSAVAH